MKLFLKIGLGLLVATNLFFISTLVYSMIKYDSRVEKNRKFIREEITKQIIQSMPDATGEVKR